MTRVTIDRGLALPSCTRVQGPLKNFVSRPTRSMKVMASLTVKESGTGVEFPLVERLWCVAHCMYEKVVDAT